MLRHFLSVVPGTVIYTSFLLLVFFSLIDLSDIHITLLNV